MYQSSTPERSAPADPSPAPDPLVDYLLSRLGDALARLLASRNSYALAHVLDAIDAALADAPLFATARPPLRAQQSRPAPEPEPWSPADLELAHVQACARARLG